MIYLKAFLFFINLLFSTFAFAISADEIVKKSDAYRYINSDISFVVEVQEIRDSENQTSRYKVFSKGSQFSRVETTYPERQSGRKLLMKSDDLWFYTPDIKRPTRVSMQQKLTGEVANGDIARTNFADDYSAKLVGEEKVSDRDAYKLLLTKKRDSVTYSGIDFWVAKKDFMPIRATFKTDSGKDLKTAIYRDPKPTLGQTILTIIEIKSDLVRNQKSILKFKNYKKEKLDDSFFNKESLNN